MMPKTVLNKARREILFQLVGDLVQSPDTQDDLDRAYRLAEETITLAIRAKYPVQDMKVLNKYGKAIDNEVIYLNLVQGGVNQFTFSPGRAPLRPTGNVVIQVDQHVTDLWHQWDRTGDMHREALKAKLKDYRALIIASKTYEDVLAVWPEAEAVRDRMGAGSTALVSAVTPDVVERIRADVEARSRLNNMKETTDAK